MIVCTQCGYDNEDSDVFCGSCGGFLEWEGQKVAPEPEQVEPEPVDEPEAGRAGLIERVKEKIGIGEEHAGGGAGADGGAVAVATEELEPAEATVQTPPPEALGPVSAPLVPASAAADAAAPAAPVAEPPPPSPADGGSTGAAATPAAVAERAEAPSATAAPTATVTSRSEEPVAAGMTAPAAPVAPQPVAAGVTAPGAPVAPQPSNAAPTAPAAGPTAPAAAATALKPAQPAQPPPAVPVKPSQPAQPPRAAAPLQPPGSSPEAAAATQPGAATPVQPGAVKPGAVKERALKNPAPTRVINPGDLICGQCGEGNDPERKFCRRCGGSLRSAAVFRLPWYRRLWRALTTGKTRTAGERPKLRRRIIGGTGGWLAGPVKAVLGVVVAALVVLSFVGPWHKSLHQTESRYYHDVANLIHPTFSPVHPVSATATSTLNGFPPTAVIDGAINTHWATGPANNGVGATLTLGLASPTNIDRIGFLDGDQDTTSTFLMEPVPETLKVVFVQSLPEKTAQGTTTSHDVPYTKTFTLKDETNFQAFTVAAKSVTSIQITIESVYPPSGSKNHNASIAEVELFEKS